MFPETESAAVHTVATGVVAIHFNANSLAPLEELKELREESKKAAELLIGTLDRKLD